MYVFIVLVACIFSRIFLSFSVSLVVTTYTPLLSIALFLSLSVYACILLLLLLFLLLSRSNTGM